MRRILVFQAITFVAFVAAVVSILLVVQQNRRLIRDGKQAHDGLCVLKADYRHRIGQSTAFLARHPNGIDGISAGVIVTSIATMQTTLDALSIIRCPTDTS
jgi:hypothetical protein